MKILYLSPDIGVPVLGRKGASIHVRELVAALARAGHDVVVAAQTLEKSPWEEPARMAAPVRHVLPSPSNAAAVAALKGFNELLGLENSLPGEIRRILYNRDFETDLKRRFEHDPPDFIYERASLYATAGVSLARTFNVPLILELNAPLAVEQIAYRATGLGPLAAQAERWTLQHASAVLVVSEPLREHVLSLGVDPNRVHVQPNGVNPAFFHPAPRDEVLRSKLKLDGGPVIGFVGGLRPWHGVEVLPELLHSLRSLHPDLQLVILGDGPLRVELERRFQVLGLSDGVVITGLLPHEEVAAVIRQFDVAVAPYTRPDHDFYFSPLKLFECMACGVPVVAPALGQISELLHQGAGGLLYPSDNREELIGACQRLLADGALRRELGHAASGRVLGRFTWDHNAARVAELGNSLVKVAREEFKAVRS